MAIKKPRIKPILPERPPIEPLELLEEEEPLEEELEETEFIVSLQRLYPTMFDPASSFGFTEEEIPFMVAQQIETFALDDPEEFLRDLITKGLDKDAAIILRAFGIGEAEVEELLAIPPIEREEPIIEPPPQPVERVVVEIKGVEQLLIRTEDNSLYDKNGDWIGFYNWADGTVFNPYLAEGLAGKALDAFVGGIGDMLNISAGVARRYGYEDVAAKLSTTGSQLAQYGVPTSSADFQVSDLLNPEFYALKVVRTFPFALSLLPLAIGGYYGGGGIATVFGLGKIWTMILAGLGGGALSRPLESALEAGGSYNDAIARGKTEKEAEDEFDEVFRNNMTLVGLDAFQIAIALAPTPKWVPAALVNSLLVRTVRIGAKVVIVGLTEGGEEVYQDMIQRRARGEEWKLDPIAKEVFSIGVVMGVGMGIGGDVLSGVVNRSRGRMPAEMKKVYDKTISDFTEQGFTQGEAELRALDEVAQTTEGAEIIKEAVDEVKAEVEPVVPEIVEPEVTPMPEVPEAVVTPEVPAVPEVVELTVKERFDKIDSLQLEMKGLQSKLSELIDESSKLQKTKDKTEAQLSRLTEINREIVPLQDRLHTIADEITELKIPTKPPAEVKPPVKKPPVEVEPVIPPDEPVSKGVISNTQGMRDVGAKEVVRPARKVLIRIGQWRELFKPTQKAEVELHEEQSAKTKMFDGWQKLLGKDKERWALVSDEINEKGSVVGLTFDEKRVVAQYRKWADEWADRKNLPEGKRIKDYMPHLFEQEAVREVKEEGGIDPVLAQILSERETKKIIDPFLKKRLGAVGWIKDPVAAARAYEAVSLKFAYYTPMLNKIDAILADPNVPQSVKKWLSGYSKRMTGELSDIDKAGNVTIREFAEKIRGVPGIGEYFYTRMTQGNPMGMVSYHLTGGLYMLFLGFKATSAIRNLSQHTLIIGEVGIQHFANGFRLRFTAEGRGVLAKSLVLRSRQFAYTAGLDASFASRWTDKFRETTLFAFRFADKQNVSDAFLSGYSEAKVLYPDAGEQVWIDRGDEVAADTQYLYTKLNSMSFSQNALGRVMSMLTTWTVNWIELMTKWVNRTPSQVYLEQERLTGKPMPKKNWSQTYKAIALYMTIVGLAFAYDDDTRLKIKEYTGIGSLRYLAGAIGGEFPALQAVGSVADMITGFLLNDERQMKAGFSEFKRTFTPGIIRQLSNVGSGEKDWMTLLFYLEGKDFHIKNLRDKWSKDWVEYIDLTDAKMRNKWREDNPLLEAQMFVAGRFSILSSDKARAEVLRLIEEHNIDTDLIDGYEKIFGVDTKAELKTFEGRIGNLEKLVIGEDAEYFTTSNYLTEVNKFITISGLAKVQKEASPFTSLAIAAQNDFDIYFDLDGDGRTLHRQLFPEVEASLYLFGKVSSFKNPKSAEILLGLMEKYNIPPEAVPAFIENPERWDEVEGGTLPRLIERFRADKDFELLGQAVEVYGQLAVKNVLTSEEVTKYTWDIRSFDWKENRVLAHYTHWGNEFHKVFDWLPRADVAQLERIKERVPNFESLIINKLLPIYKTEKEGFPIRTWNAMLALAIDKYGAEELKERVEEIGEPNQWDRIKSEIDEIAALSEEMREAYTNGFSGTLGDDYVGYYEIPSKGYANERYLMEHDEFYQMMVEMGIWKEKDFSNVPTERFEKTFIEYEGLDLGSARYNFRGKNPWFDEEGVRLGKWKPFGEPRAKPKPRVESKEVEEETDFRERQRELEEALEGLK